MPKKTETSLQFFQQKKSKTKVHIQSNPKIFEPWWIREIPKQKKSIQSKIPFKKMVQRLPSHPIPSPKRPCCWVRWCVPNRKDLMNNKFWEPPWFVWVLDLDPKGVVYLPPWPTQGETSRAPRSPKNKKKEEKLVVLAPERCQVKTTCEPRWSAQKRCQKKVGSFFFFVLTECTCLEMCCKK